MSLPDLMKEFDDYGTFQIYDIVTSNDGYGGQLAEKYVPGGTFQGVLILNNSINAQSAQKQGVTGVYTLSIDKVLRLPWHTVFQKLILDENGAVIGRGSVYRVTTKDDNSPPKSASLTMQFRQVTCEEWKLPKELQSLNTGG